MDEARRVLITGAEGFVGAYLTAHLAAAYPTWQVTGTTRDEAGSASPLVRCDLRNADAVAALVRGCSAGDGRPPRGAE